ncbi:hypothetical protein LAZ67_4003010 [Cordylochernes scorpioides]|uniref:CCHC-type domain-containing protein n=1 Tax=Cordylochernes scorpioides TaxID=51811 RepID=A0ABY6KF43_9ARAC|nr:hypothetical protein LAZ67_4003010 [Cordylochernes scorpioides]
MEVSNMFSVLADSQYDGEQNGAVPFGVTTTNAEISAENNSVKNVSISETKEKYAKSPVTSGGYANSPQSSRNWADIVENDENFEQPKKRKRLLPSESASQPLPGPSRQTKTTRDSTTPRQPSCPRNTIEQIKVSRQMLAQCRSKAAAGTYDQMTYLEFYPEFTQVDYIKALENKLGKGCVVQIGKASGQILVGFERPDMAETIIEDGLMIKGALLKALPYQKKAEKITISGLPFVIEDADIIRTLRPYCQGGSALAYLEYGFRCSKCYRMGHKRMNCPRIIRETSTTQPLSQTSSVKTTAPAPNTTAAASPPATFSHPAPVAAPAQTSSAPPAQEDIALETEPTTRTPETSTQTDLNINRVENSSHHKIKDRSRSLSPKAGSTTQLQLDTLLERLPGSFFEEVTLLGLKEEEVKQAIVSLPHLRLLLGKLSVEQSLGLHTFNEKLIKGLGSSKSIELCCFLKQHAVDIAFIQETNVTTLDSVEDLCLGYRAAVVPASGARGSGLACIFSSGVQVIGQQVLSPGKIAAFDVTIRGSKATFVNCHLSHAPDERLQQLQVIAAAAVNEDAWVLGDLNISEESASDIASGSVEALGELLDRANLVDAAAIFDATHLPTRISSCGSRVDASRLDRVLIPSSFSNRVTRYWSLYYKNSDHRAVLLQTGEASEPRPPCIASMLRSRLVVGTVETLLDEALGNIEDLRNAEIWRRWGHIKAHLASAIKSLHDLRNNDDDYISRARKYVQAKLEDKNVIIAEKSAEEISDMEMSKSDKNEKYANSPSSKAYANSCPASRDWAETIEEASEKAYKMERKKRKLSPSTEQARRPQPGTYRHTTQDRVARPPQPPRKYAVTQLKNNKQQQALSKSRSAAATFDQRCFVEWHSDLSPVDYIKALEEKAWKILGVPNGEDVRPGLTIGTTLLKAFPHKKREERIAIGHLPIAIRDEDVVAQMPPKGTRESLLPLERSWKSSCPSSGHTEWTGASILPAHDLHKFRSDGVLTPSRRPPWPHPDHPASAGPSFPAWGSPMAPWAIGTGAALTSGPSSARPSKPLAVPLISRLGSSGTGLVGDELAILASVKSKINRYFVQVGLGQAIEDPVIAWRRTLSRSVARQEQHLLTQLDSACRKWTPFTRGLSLVGRAKAANTLVLSTTQHHLHGYLPGEATITKLQARLRRFIWGPERTAWFPADIVSRPVTLGGLGLLDIGAQLHLACLKSVQAALRGGKNGFSWLLLELPIIGGCRFLRLPNLLSPARWSGVRVADLRDAPDIRPTRSSLADAVPLVAFCRRMLEENLRESTRAACLAEAVILRGTNTPFSRLTTRLARRALERPHLAAQPITRLLSRWTSVVDALARLDWTSLRRCAFSGHDADSALRLDLHALPHPNHPASTKYQACGSVDRSLDHCYWSCRLIRPLIIEAFSVLGRPPDLRAWIFGSSLEDDDLAILASAKSIIYRYFVQVGLTGGAEDPLIAWERRLTRRGTSPA